MTRWWSGQGDERFWIEVTSRLDIGADLHAPKLDRSGKRNWRYNLIEEASVGDVVFHYDTRNREIVGFSVVSGPPRSDKIKWAARGTYARKERAQPIEVDSTKVPLEGLVRLDPPVSRETLRMVAPMIGDLVGAPVHSSLFSFSMIDLSDHLRDRPHVDPHGGGLVDPADLDA